MFTHPVRTGRRVAFVAGLASLLLALAPAVAGAGGSISGSWFAADLGPGGWAGGTLLADGTATGSGELAVPIGPGGAITAHFTAVSWTLVGPDVGVTVNQSGAGGGSFCLVLPVTKGAPSHSVAIGATCGSATSEPGLAGKATLLG